MTGPGGQQQWFNEQPLFHNPSNSVTGDQFHLNFSVSVKPACFNGWRKTARRVKTRSCLDIYEFFRYNIHLGVLIVPPCGVSSTVSENCLLSNTPDFNHCLISPLYGVLPIFLGSASWLIWSKHLDISVSKTYLGFKCMML